MADVQQILQLNNQDTREARAQARKDRMDAAEKKRKRPENVNREVFALLGDQEPQMLPAVNDESQNSADAGQPIKRPKLDRQVDKWVQHPFRNPARTDSLQLAHWVKNKECNEAYQFARFNRKTEVITYTDDEYRIVEKISQDSDQAQWCDWTKQETDLLFDLCQRFQLRFIIIADRFQQELEDIITKKRELKAIQKSDRSIDELKDRYYSVSKSILIARNQKSHPIVCKPFSYEHEVRRKQNLEKIFMRTKEQQEREKQMIINLKNIDAKIKKVEKEEQNLARLVANDLEEMKLPFSSKKIQKVSGVMLLSNRLTAKLPVSDNMHQQITAVLQSMRIKTSELHCSQPVLDEFENLRELLLTFFSLEKYIKDRQEELCTVKEQHSELDTLKMVYEKSAQHNSQKYKFQAQQAQQQQQIQAIQQEQERNQKLEQYQRLQQIQAMNPDHKIVAPSVIDSSQLMLQQIQQSQKVQQPQQVAQQVRVDVSSAPQPAQSSQSVQQTSQPQSAALLKKKKSLSESVVAVTARQNQSTRRQQNIQNSGTSTPAVQEQQVEGKQIINNQLESHSATHEEQEQSKSRKPKQKQTANPKASARTNAKVQLASPVVQANSSQVQVAEQTDEIGSQSQSAEGKRSGQHSARKQNPSATSKTNQSKSKRGGQSKK